LQFNNPAGNQISRYGRPTGRGVPYAQGHHPGRTHRSRFHANVSRVAHVPVGEPVSHLPIKSGTGFRRNMHRHRAAWRRRQRSSDEEQADCATATPGAARSCAHARACRDGARLDDLRILL
jgi:hypothetical protein